MKNIFEFIKGATACLALLVVLGMETKAVAQDYAGEAMVVRMHGKARVSSDGKTWQTLKKGAHVPAGAMIQTAENATLDLALRAREGRSVSGEPAEGVLRMQGDTFLSIDHLGAGTGAAEDVELDLRGGQVAGNAGQLPAGSRYEIKFSKGVAGVRSGIFHLSSSGFVAVPLGETVMVILGADGNPITTIVNAGKEFDPATGMMNNIPKSSSAPSTTPQDKTEPPPAATPPTATPKGPGMGGSLRKF